ncbi:hypothetical protein BDW42DRAFT_196942 [Aspergillus taichungensis]|uniref:Heterokaryon incompatibility domain-containing protein n=1 Tax=Aspergillus taichungensis TaxID=482145 RepID=A0A2J5HIB0_9EURO|nr:hypothetical protein BDW42DRAFT_196942 [Aspergillus taichungensis]
MQVQQKTSKLNPTHRLVEEVSRSTGYKELTEAVNFGSTELTNIGKVMKDKDLAKKLYHFIAYYVAPTAHSDFKMFDNDKLNSWKNANVSEAQRWLAIPEEDRSVPFRMIDLSTGNLVETRNYGPMDQYCILSHSWKGQEIDYGFFARAKRSNERLESTFGDVEAVKTIAENGASKPKTTLHELIKSSSECKKLNICTVEDMLKIHFDLLKMEKDCISADKEVRQAIDLHTSATWESEHYRAYVAELHVGQSNSGKVEGSQVSQAANKKLLDEITRLHEDAEKNERNSDEKRKMAYSTLEEHQAEFSLLMSDTKIMYAIEDLLQALYYRKSAKKLSGAVDQAKDIFKKKPFAQTRRRYLWLDNCCINKANGAELTESLARMGEWYANADFCLVHVDTSPDDQEWVQESKSVPLLDPDQGNQTQSKNMDGNLDEKSTPNFDDLITIAQENKKIHWATRGWTLQELVLSRVTYYFDSNYKSLERDVGSLGPYYYLAPFIKQYLSLPWVKPDSFDRGVKVEQFNKDTANEFIKKFQKLRLDLPRDIDKRTAAAQIGRMVYVAATSNVSTSKTLHENGLDPNNLGQNVNWINDLLSNFVREVDAAITKDREYVQQIGRIGRLANWADGSEPLNASARNILKMASEREVTVPIDQVYSLMGILGVRFPAFPAEGPQKALCRLLDEVIITSNDVSVFNWSGRNSGSSIRGRTMYPRSIEAFQGPMDKPSLRAQATISRGIIRLFQNERYHKAKRADAVNRCLNSIVQQTDALEKTMFAPLKELVEVILEKNFDCVANHLIDLNMMVKDLEGVIERERNDKKLQKQARREKRKSPSKTGFAYETADAIMNCKVSDAFNVPSFGGWKKEKPSQDMMKLETTEQVTGRVPTEDSEPTTLLPAQSQVKNPNNKNSNMDFTETDTTEKQKQDQTTDTSISQPDPKAREQKQEALYVPNFSSFGLGWKKGKSSKNKIKPETTEQAAGRVSTDHSEPTTPLLAQPQIKNPNNKSDKMDITEADTTEKQTTDTPTPQPDLKAREQEQEALHVPSFSSFGLGWKKGKPGKNKTKPETTEQAAGGISTEDSELDTRLLSQSQVKDLKNKNIKVDITETEITETRKQDQTTDTPTPQPDPKAREREWANLKEAVEELTTRIRRDYRGDKALSGLDHGPEDQTQAEKDAQEHAPGSNSLDTKMVCPNPIIVTSAGIRGVFDIQRVVIGMQQRDILRSKLHNAVPGQRIEGSCTISTGFSLMLVKFTCEREILEQQLDVTEVIDRQLSQKLNSKDDISRPVEPKNDASKKPQNTSDGGNLKATGEAATDEKHTMEKAPEAKKNDDPKHRGREGEDTGENEEQTYGGKWNQGQQRVHRIVKLVQEDDLHAVAGEWVLARFSDVVGADWFLCRLELGSTNEFYARRIPTDAINFHDAVPESGLVDHWQAYMTEHKNLMCEYLSMFLQSQMKFESMDKLVESMLPSDGQGDENSPSKMALFQAIRQGVSGVKYGAMAIYLGGIMEDEAIRSVPTKLRPAVRKMKKGGILFPMMYHPSKHVHMF